MAQVEQALTAKADPPEPQTSVVGDRLSPAPVAEVFLPVPAETRGAAQADRAARLQLDRSRAEQPVRQPADRAARWLRS